MTKDTERIADLTANQFHYCVLRHYECLIEFPEGLMPIGESICSVKPLPAKVLSYLPRMDAA